MSKVKDNVKISEAMFVAALTKIASTIKSTDEECKFVPSVKPSLEIRKCKNEAHEYYASYIECLERVSIFSKSELMKMYPGEYNSMRGAKERALKTHIRFDSSLKDFRDWLAHIGPKPDSTWTADRKDYRKGYIVGNIRWASKLLQTQNRQVTQRHKMPNGELKTTKELAAFLGLKYRTVYKRLKSGWTVERMLSTRPLGVQKWRWWNSDYQHLETYYLARPKSEWNVPPLEWLIKEFLNRADRASSPEELLGFNAAARELQRQRSELVEEETKSKTAENEAFRIAALGPRPFETPTEVIKRPALAGSFTNDL